MLWCVRATLVDERQLDTHNRLLLVAPPSPSPCCRLRRGRTSYRTTASRSSRSSSSSSSSSSHRSLGAGRPPNRLGAFPASTRADWSVCRGHAPAWGIPSRRRREKSSLHLSLVASVQVGRTEVTVVNMEFRGWVELGDAHHHITQRTCRFLTSVLHVSPNAFERAAFRSASMAHTHTHTHETTGTSPTGNTN